MERQAFFIPTLMGEIYGKREHRLTVFKFIVHLIQQERE